MKRFTFAAITLVAMGLTLAACGDRNTADICGDLATAYGCSYGINQVELTNAQLDAIKSTCVATLESEVCEADDASKVEERAQCFLLDGATCATDSAAVELCYESAAVMSESCDTEMESALDTVLKSFGQE